MFFEADVLWSWCSLKLIFLHHCCSLVVETRLFCQLHLSAPQGSRDFRGYGAKQQHEAPNWRCQLSWDGSKQEGIWGWIPRENFRTTPLNFRETPHWTIEMPKSSQMTERKSPLNVCLSCSFGCNSVNRCFIIHLSYQHVLNWKDHNSWLSFLIERFPETTDSGVTKKYS